VVLNQKKEQSRDAPPDEQETVKAKAKMYAKMLDLSHSLISDSKDFYFKDGDTTSEEYIFPLSHAQIFPFHRQKKLKF
jgi:hypothetical protein